MASRSIRLKDGNGALRDARRRMQLNQEDVEGDVGVPQSVLSDLEKGLIPSQVVHAIRLARRYGSSVEDLFGHSVGPWPGKVSSDAA